MFKGDQCWGCHFGTLFTILRFPILRSKLLTTYLWGCPCSVQILWFQCDFNVRLGWLFPSRIFISKISFHVNLGKTSSVLLMVRGLKSLLYPKISNSSILRVLAFFNVDVKHSVLGTKSRISLSLLRCCSFSKKFLTFSLLSLLLPPNFNLKT